MSDVSPAADINADFLTRPSRDKLRSILGSLPKLPAELNADFSQNQGKSLDNFNIVPFKWALSFNINVKWLILSTYYFFWLQHLPEHAHLVVRGWQTKRVIIGRGRALTRFNYWRATVTCALVSSVFFSRRRDPGLESRAVKTFKRRKINRC